MTPQVPRRSRPGSRPVDAALVDRDEPLRTAMVFDVGGDCTRVCHVPIEAEAGIYRDLVRRVRCRNCPSCLRARRYQWCLRAEVETIDAPATWFFTGTFAKQSHDIAEVSDDMTRFLKRLRKKVGKRVGPDAFRYLAVPERHKSGAWHWHALLHHDGSLLFEDFETWDEGWWWLRRVNGTGMRAAKYVTKYTTKSMYDEEKSPESGLHARLGMAMRR